MRHIDIDDAQSVLRAIRATPPGRAIEIILHTPGGLVLAASQIARALRDHDGRVIAVVPHYAMSGGTLIALAADELYLDRHSALGPIDPQLGQYPAASLVEVASRPGRHDDQTLLLADVGGKAIRQVESLAQYLLEPRFEPERARDLAHLLSTGVWTHDHPLMAADLEKLGLPVRLGVPAEVRELMDLYPQPRGRAVPRAFDFTTLLGEEGWAGDGYELTNPGQIEMPEQAELPLEAMARLEPWMRQPAPTEPDPPAPLAPSQPLPDEAVASPRAFSPLAPADSRRWQRGRLMHELLRHLPVLAVGERARAARRFLAQPAHGLADEEISLWVDEVLAVTEAPDHAALFAEGSRAEVPLIGTVRTRRGTFTVSGQVDRLAVFEHEVLIVDYKTNRPPPASAPDVALAYRRQLALYRTLLAGIYPGRTVRAFLLWTAAPLLMEIDAETLEKSMPYAAAS